MEPARLEVDVTTAGHAVDMPKASPMTSPTETKVATKVEPSLGGNSCSAAGFMTSSELDTRVVPKTEPDSTSQRQPKAEPRATVKAEASAASSIPIGIAVARQRDEPRRAAAAPEVREPRARVSPSGRDRRANSSDRSDNLHRLPARSEASSRDGVLSRDTAQPPTSSLLSTWDRLWISGASHPLLPPAHPLTDRVRPLAPPTQQTLQTPLESLGSAHLDTSRPPPGYKFSQDALTGQFYLVPDMDPSRSWPYLSPGSRQMPQLDLGLGSYASSLYPSSARVDLSAAHLVEEFRREQYRAWEELARRRSQHDAAALLSPNVRDGAAAQLCSPPGRAAAQAESNSPIRRSMSPPQRPARPLAAMDSSQVEADSTSCRERSVDRRDEVASAAPCTVDTRPLMPGRSMQSRGTSPIVELRCCCVSRVLKHVHSQTDLRHNNDAQAQTVTSQAVDSACQTDNILPSPVQLAAVTSRPLNELMKAAQCARAKENAPSRTIQQTALMDPAVFAAQDPLRMLSALAAHAQEHESSQRDLTSQTSGNCDSLLNPLRIRTNLGPVEPLDMDSLYNGPRKEQLPTKPERRHSLLSPATAVGTTANLPSPSLRSCSSDDAFSITSSIPTPGDAVGEQVREKLLEIQRKYREKQRELAKLQSLSKSKATKSKKKPFTQAKALKKRSDPRASPTPASKPEPKTQTHTNPPTLHQSAEESQLKVVPDKIDPVEKRVRHDSDSATSAAEDSDYDQERSRKAGSSGGRRDRAISTVKFGLGLLANYSVPAATSVALQAKKRHQGAPSATDVEPVKQKKPRMCDVTAVKEKDNDSVEALWNKRRSERIFLSEAESPTIPTSTSVVPPKSPFTVWGTQMASPIPALRPLSAVAVNTTLKPRVPPSPAPPPMTSGPKRQGSSIAALSQKVQRRSSGVGSRHRSTEVPPASSLTSVALYSSTQKGNVASFTTKKATSETESSGSDYSSDEAAHSSDKGSYNSTEASPEAKVVTSVSLATTLVSQNSSSDPVVASAANIPSEIKVASTTDDAMGDVKTIPKDEADVPVETKPLEAPAVVSAPSFLRLNEGELTAGRRVLYFLEGLFYAASLSDIQPPDIYGVLIDGERGHRPHILSREEVLRDCVRDVRATAAQEMRSGTRVCAYWSQQFSCLYPGCVEAVEDCKGERRLVTVEFDDGDSGRIPLDNVRLIPADIPKVDYEVAPLMLAGKRRSRVSLDDCFYGDTKERRMNEQQLPVRRNKAEKTENSDKGAPTNAKNNTPSRPVATVSSAVAPRTTTPSKTNAVAPIKVTPTKPSMTPSKGVKNSAAIVATHNGSSDQAIEAKTTELATYEAVPLPSTPVKRSDAANAHATSSRDGHSPNRRRGSTPAKGDKSRSKADKTPVKTVEKKTPIKNAIKEGNTTDDSVSDSSPESLSAATTSGFLAHAQMMTSAQTDNPFLTTPPPFSGQPLFGSARLGAHIARHSVRGAGSGANSPARASSTDSNPDVPIWTWEGQCTKRSKGKTKRAYYRAISRARPEGDEVLRVGDCAVFTSLGRPTLPFIGRITYMWESHGQMVVRVKWFYHPDEAKGGRNLSHVEGALYESAHEDENDVQTISHGCKLLSYNDWKQDPPEGQNVYYLAGSYDPTNGALKLAKDVKAASVKK